MSSFFTSRLLTMVESTTGDWTIGLFACLVVGTWLVRRYKSSVKPTYFPSPPGDPVLGHLRYIPSSSQWIKFSEWGKKLGDVIYVHFLGTPAIILDSTEAARDILDKRSANFSDRPTSILHGEMMNWNNLTFALQYGDQLRRQRRFMHEYMNSHAVSSLRLLQTEHAHSLVRSLLKDPDNFDKHVYRMSAAIIVKLTYGFDVAAEDDDLVEQISKPSSRGAKAGVPGLSPPDLLPFLRYIPSWLPGAGFKREAEEIQELTDKIVNDPFDRVKKERALGLAQPSFVYNMLERNSADGGVDETDMRYSAAMMFGAGVETSEATMLTFFLMMATNTHVMKRAQVDIDSVTRKSRLPTIDDRLNLPYVDCILKEVFRINPPIPLCIPHKSTKEEYYRGRVIPAGTMIIPNIWSMMRDERYFTDPEYFDPDRFYERIIEARAADVDSLQQFGLDDPTSLVFGFGRRICPGRFLAESNIWLAISNVLAIFDILPSLDPHTGDEVIPDVEFAGGFSNKPKPFKCRLVPRDRELTSIVTQKC